MRAFLRIVPTRRSLSMTMALVITATQPLLALSATCTVNSAADDTSDASEKVVTVDPSGWVGPGSTSITLRDCIVAANLMTGAFGEPTSPGMNINLHAVAGQTITLFSLLPIIFNNLTIDAGDDAPVTISGNNVNRVFLVSGLPALAHGNVAASALLVTDNDGARPISVAMHGLIIANGLAEGGSSNDGGGGLGAGGGLFVNKNANVALTNVSFSSNRALGGVSANGQSFGLGGGGMGAGFGGAGGGGLGTPSDVAGANGGGLAGDDAPGFGGIGMGQLSAAQTFDPFQFGVGFHLGGRVGEGGTSTYPDGGFGAGGASLTIATTAHGGFGGGGGSRFARPGGFGGGGGHDPGIYGGGNGGFGAGGGKGDFFNGQGAPAGSGGVGAGAGSDFNQGGGGGAGFGGAVFVRAGASLTIHGSNALSIDGNTSTGGGAFNSGAAAGAGIFAMSGAATTFDIDSVATISDEFDDDSNIVLPSGQSYTQGCATGADPACGTTISKTGKGTLVTNARVYAISISITGGTIEANDQLGYQDVLVNAGGRLSGTGTVDVLTVSAGGIVSPGHVTTSGAAGNLHSLEVKWHSQGIEEFHLGSSQATSSAISAGSMLSIAGDSGLRYVRALIGPSTPTIGTTYNLVNCSQNCTGFPNFKIALSDIVLDPASTVRGTLGLTTSHLTLTVTQVISDRIFYSGVEY
jgi:hypothetical protein